MDKTRIVVDTFGGDNAPLAVIEGAVAAASEDTGLSVILCGDRAKIEACANEHSIDISGLEIAQASQVIPVEEEPTKLLKEYGDSSMAVGMGIVAKGEADAFVSAGSTGALAVGATFIVKRIKSIKRAALATVIPTVGTKEAGAYMLIDMGANSECRPEMLVQFAMMASVYMQRVAGIKNPRVGLANIGAEESKGTALQVETYALLKNSGLNFTGNIEAREIPSGGCDVVVADGFTGNIILKLTEGLAKAFSNEIKFMLTKSVFTKLSALGLSKGIKAFKGKLDYSEHGGAPFLGVTKPVIKAHGSADAKTIKNTIKQAAKISRENVIGEVEKALAESRAKSSAGSAAEETAEEN